jgi:hypothetical protein
MHLTSSGAFAAISTVSVGWLMIRAGSAKGLLRIRVENRCAACGRRRKHGRCPCITGR